MPEDPDPYQPKTPDFTNPAPLRNTEESSYISYMYNRLPFKETQKGLTLSQKAESVGGIISIIAGILSRTIGGLLTGIALPEAVETVKVIDRAREAKKEREAFMRDYCPACGPYDVNYDKQLEKQYEKRLE